MIRNEISQNERCVKDEPAQAFHWMIWAFHDVKFSQARLGRQRCIFAFAAFFELSTGNKKTRVLCSNARPCPAARRQADLCLVR